MFSKLTKDELTRITEAFYLKGVSGLPLPSELVAEEAAQFFRRLAIACECVGTLLKQERMERQ